MFKHGFLKVAAATPPIEVGHIEHNQNEIIRLLDQTKAGMIVFPELTITGYTASDLFFQESFIKEAKETLKTIMDTTTYQGVYLLGMPLEIKGTLYNCAVVVQQKQILGVIPKYFLPNHHEFYEKRWFHSGKDVGLTAIELWGQIVPFGRLLFEDNHLGIRFGVEICQDLWSPYPPSDEMSLAGANLIFNLSASTEYIGKEHLRRQVVLDHSRKQIAAYVYTTTGHYESSSETIFSSHKMVASMGEMIAESQPFSLTEEILVADIDLTSINYQKRQDSTFKDLQSHHESQYQIVPFTIIEADTYVFETPLERYPFLPIKDQQHQLKTARNIQVYALMKKIMSLPKEVQKLVIGVSGGVDSTWALLVAHEAMKRLGLDSKKIIGVLMPAEATRKESMNNALELVQKLGVTILDISIKDAVEQHLKDIDHQEEDVTYENVQARIRTLTLMNLANKHGGIVLGTSDLSEIALGWMTYNGDQMSMYAINAGLPKTVVRSLLMYFKDTEYRDLKTTIGEIIDQPISPELIKNQETEMTLGRYIINDFMLYHHLQCGADEMKMKWLLEMAFALSDKEAKAYVNRFFTRFYNNQFKRQTLPEGPKVLGVSLSPRGEYRLPSDIKKKVKL
ncbi:MAG: NAD(+) synthase [Acholeplasmataceae bacterium]|nr:NAD(+) synthase [Acholeplasmataceae bacterium]